MKRFMATILIAMMVLCFGAIANAESASTRDSDYFNSYGITISRQGGGKLNITMSCSSVGTASQLGVSTYSVQKHTSSGWVSVASGSGSYKYNTTSYALAKTFSGVAGEKYRVTCTFLCTKNGTSETKTYTSRSVTAN